MNRRSNIVEGMVKFPIDALQSSNEGGMFVQLWIFDEREVGYGVCCGTEFSATSSECFIGSDITKELKKETDKKIVALWGSSNLSKFEQCYEKELILRKEITDRFFVKGEYTEKSRLLIANILLGSTGWSNSEFIATYDDLKGSGQLIYNLLKEQYPEATFALMTFLDT